MRKEPAEVAMEAPRLKQEEGEGVEEAVAIPLHPNDGQALLKAVGYKAGLASLRPRSLVHIILDLLLRLLNLGI